MKIKAWIIFVAILLIGTGEVYPGRTWYQKAPFGGEARHRCTGFSIGNKGYVGGGHINSGAVITYSDYWEYDPATNTWTQIADFGGGPRYHSSSFTIGNEAYVGGGENATHDYTNDFWKYIPTINTWIPIADFPGVPRRGGCAFTLDGMGYYGTGQSNAGYEVDFYRYNPEENAWTTIADFIGEARSSAVSFTFDSKAYLGTGHLEGTATNDFYMYDPVADAWEAKTDVGGSIRQNAVGFCIDGKGYIGTGDDNIDADFGDLWEYDFAADTWTRIDDFKGQKRRYAVTFVIGNTLYLSGGTNGTNFRDLWAYEINLSITENSQSEPLLRAYPVPANENITIATNFSESELKNISYRISDLSGRMYVKDVYRQNILNLTKSDLGSGTFIVTLFDENKEIASKTIILN